MPIVRQATLSIIALAVASSFAPGPVVAAPKSAAMKAMDPDNDGKISLQEAETAGAKKFAAMDPDNDGKVDMKEAKGTLKATFKSADPDKDGAIDKAEYTALIEDAFKKADPDADGQLDAKELASPAGKTLLGLIQ